jgi:hypothetical protein
VTVQIAAIAGFLVDDHIRDVGEPGRVAVQVPAGSFIRSTSGHVLLVTGGQESAHSHPPALATTGAGNDCAAQVAPALPVICSVPVPETTQIRVPSTAATCSRAVDCGAAGSSVPLVTQCRPASLVVASRTGWAWK